MCGGGRELEEGAKKIPEPMELYNKITIKKLRHYHLRFKAAFLTPLYSLLPFSLGRPTSHWGSLCVIEVASCATWAS